MQAEEQASHYQSTFQLQCSVLGIDVCLIISPYHLLSALPSTIIPVQPPQFHLPLTAAVYDTVHDILTQSCALQNN